MFATVKQKGNRVIVKIDKIPKLDSEVETYLDEIRAIYDQNKKFIILYDCENMGWMSMKHLHMQAKFMRSQESRTKDLMVRAAIYLPNKAGKTLLNTLFKLVKPACELQVFDNIVDAKKFLSEADI